MQIQYATHIEKPAIIELLKASLGEGSSPKSLDYWHWKHEINPFGPSPVLLAKENDELVGVRAFMRWQWQNGHQSFSALRAVDTATHPNHQGKGIFKKLTLQLVDACTQAGDHFVFNTPNDNSRPGYLKMGWIQVGKIPVGIKPFPQGFFYRRKADAIQKEADLNVCNQLCDAWNQQRIQENKLFTPKSGAYLLWRYVNNPVLTYRISADESHFVAAYGRQRGRLRELRVSELVLDAASKAAKKKAAQAVRKAAVAEGAHFITYSPVHHDIVGGMMGRVAAIGPILTLRQLAAPAQDWQTLANLANWNPVLGDMELF